LIRQVWNGDMNAGKILCNAVCGCLIGMAGKGLVGRLLGWFPKVSEEVMKTVAIALVVGNCQGACDALVKYLSTR